MADLVHSTTTTKASTGSIISLAVPNTSYDSAIDSLPDEYGLIDFHRSSPTIIDNSNCIRHVGLTSPSSPLTTNNITSSSNRPHQLHRPLLRSIASSTKCANHNHHHHQQLKQRQTYRSISEHQCQHDTIEQPHVQSPLLVNKVNQTINRTSMAMFLDQIDASSTLLGNGKSQTSSSSSSSSSANQKQLVVIGQHSHSAQQQRGLKMGVSPTFNMNNNSEHPQQTCSMRVRHSGQCHPHLVSVSSSNNCGGIQRQQQQKQQQQQQQRVCNESATTPIVLATDSTTTTTTTTSSSLRSSRSFTTTTSYRQRPNVTLIRRKSASERLAESRCKYIRNNSIVNDDEASVGGSIVSGGLTDYCETDEMDNVSRARSNRATPTSSHTTTTSSSCLSPILDHIGSPTNTMDDKYSNQLVPNLVERINCQLSKTNKKRISPKNSDSSIANHGMSNLEIQLRELITDNDTSTDVADEQMLLSQNVPSQIEPQEDLKESEHLYRAELKYITSSSTSSLSSMYSEPDEIDLQQSPISEIKPTLVAPPGGQQSSHYTNVVRSKSDISQLKNKSQKLNNSNRFRECFGEHIDRLFGSLSLESGSDPNRKSIRKSSDSSNVQNYTTSSLSHDSLDMIKPIASQVVPFGLLSQQKVSVAAKSSSTNELSSLESSHLSTGVTADQIYKNSLNHSKSTSKLTFENLIRHQQTLASSRSCHNLVVATLNNGTSVVERNARIIKWLFNCRKAMNQQAQHSTSVNACV